MIIWEIDPANLTPYYDKALCSALSSAGHDVHFFTTKYLYDESLTYPDTFKINFHYFQQLEFQILLKFPIVRRGLRLLSYPLDHWRLLQKCRQVKPDVIHMQWSRVPIFDLWFIKQVQKLGIRVVHTVHDIVPIGQAFAKIGLNAVYQQCDSLIVHSQANKETLLVEVEGLNEGKVQVIPHLEIPFPLPDNVNPQQARKILNIPPDATVVLFFGFIKPYKGIDILLEVIRLANSATNNIHWLIVGRPDSENQKAYLNVIADLDRTYIHNYFVPDERVWVYHLAANIAVFPYRNIYQSGALITAMGFGLPVVATDVGSFSETIVGNGKIVPKENPQAFADALIHILSNEEQLRTMGQRSIEIVVERFGAQTIAQKHIELYQNLVKMK